MIRYSLVLFSIIQEISDCLGDLYDKKVLILAGGSGTGFWPRSTNGKPKQFLKITSDRTMLQETFDRMKEFTSQENIRIVTNKDHSNHVSEQLPIPEENVIIEPAARNTAVVIALGISSMDDEDVVAVLPSDHFIKDVERFLEILHSAAKFADEEDVIVTLGIKPTKSETGYGYIEVDKRKPKDPTGIYSVKRFHEKPNEETAYSYVESGNFLWNSGMFIFKVSVMKKTFRKYLPGMYKAFFESEEKNIDRMYESIESISIDNGIIKKADNIFTIPSEFGWSDVGSWDALYELFEKDKNGNYSEAEKAVFRNAKNCGIFTDDENRVVVLHLDDVIVVVNGDDILVTKRGMTQDVKNIKFD